MLKFRWPIYWVSRVEPAPAISARLQLDGAEFIVTWHEIPKCDPPSPEVGECVFCKRKILCNEEHLSVSDIAGRSFYGEILSCEDCAKKKGLKW